MKAARAFLGILLIALTQTFVTAIAAETNAPKLTLQKIFDSAEFNGESFSGRWIEGLSGYTSFESSKETRGARDLVFHDTKTGEKTILIPGSEFIPGGESTPLAIESHTWSKDRSRVLIFTNSKKVWRSNTRGDYWVLDLTSRELIKLGGKFPASTLMFAKFSPDGHKVAYVQERNIYVEDLRTGKILVLTKTNNEHIINGTFDWVYEEELFLRDGFLWSPDGRSIAYWQLNTEGVREFTLINTTDSLYPKTQVIQYPKAGELNSSGRVGVVNVDTFETKWLDIPGDPRNHYIFDLEWIEHSQDLFIQQLNRLQNTNRVMVANVETGEVKTILTDSDAAWVSAHQNLKWIDKGNKFVFWSERDGWQHLYLANRKSGKLSRITRGDYDVVELLHVDEKNDTIYFLASPKNPTQRYLYRTTLGGKQPERITPDSQAGSHSYRISPDGLSAFHTWSSFDVPPLTELISLPDHKVIRTLADNKKLKERLTSLELPATEFFRVEVSKGVDADAWLIKPAKFDATKKYPLLLHIYGEPAGSTIRDTWGGKTHLWHHMLAQQGYLVMSIDNRGTATPRGREWRKSIYRQVGILASKDQATALENLLGSRPYIDKERVGIWGWSGGGSMTLNAILRYPKLYHTGIAIAAVPNMRLYDTIYQERYMGLPSDNAEGYRKGSPLTYANQLQGNLLLIHGTGDDNVHFQGAEMLVNELIRHGKQFRYMAYPNRSHSISEGANTTMHLRELMTSFLHEKLPTGPR